MEYVRVFERKWLRSGAGSDEPLIGGTVSAAIAFVLPLREIAKIIFGIFF